MERIFWQYRGRFEIFEARFDQSPGRYLFRDISRVIYESLKSRLKRVIYEFPSSMTASEKYRILYSKPKLECQATYSKVCAKTSLEDEYISRA